MITDGEPTAHITPTATCSSTTRRCRETVEATLREVAALHPGRHPHQHVHARRQQLPARRSSSSSRRSTAAGRSSPRPRRSATTCWSTSSSTSGSWSAAAPACLRPATRPSLGARLRARLPLLVVAHEMPPLRERDVVGDNDSIVITPVCGAGSSPVRRSRTREDRAGGPATMSTSRTDRRPAISWQDHANCLGVDPDLFFPERGASTREAKEVCRGCVVRARLPRVRPRKRREVRHLGRALRAGTAPHPPPAGAGRP